MSFAQSRWACVQMVKNHVYNMCCPPSLQNNTANVVIQQNSSKLLMMDILRSETC